MEIKQKDSHYYVHIKRSNPCTISDSPTRSVHVLISTKMPKKYLNPNVFNEPKMWTMVAQYFDLRSF